MKDILGNELAVGDFVLYAAKCRGGDIAMRFAVLVKATSEEVKYGYSDRLYTKYDFTTKFPSTKWKYDHTAKTGEHIPSVSVGHPEGPGRMMKITLEQVPEALRQGLLDIRLSLNL